MRIACWSRASGSRASSPNSGYPYVVKRLRRGQPLKSAVELYRGTRKDVSTRAGVLRDAQNRVLPVITQGTDFFHSKTFTLGAKSVRRIAIPAKAYLVDMIDGRVIIQSQEAWSPAGTGKHFPAGSLLSVDLAQLRADPAHLRPTLIYAPGERESLQGASAAKDVLLVSVLDNVRGRTLLFRPGANGTWTRSALELPDNSSVDVADASHADDSALLTVTNFLTPPSLWLADAAKGTASEIMRQPAKFDATGLTVDQREARSSDGTKIPYFIVHRKDMPLNGNNPTLLYAYGGFEVPMTPSYSATHGKLWLEKGGVYVLANIRGGGEFGPKWHEAGLNVHRQIIYDDFAAVAKDLIATKVTSPRRLGIEGGSNGGLLMGVEFTQHPELWNAVMIEVPLLDMIRISKIAAGASWEGEYGSMTTRRCAPSGTRPRPIKTSRRTAAIPFPSSLRRRKTTGSARSMRASSRPGWRNMACHSIYYENTEGGHAAGANLKQVAHTNALEMVYLTRKLMDPEEPAAPGH